MQDLQLCVRKEADVNSRLRGILTGAFQRGLPQREGVDLGTAALVVSGSLVVRATTLRGSSS